MGRPLSGKTAPKGRMSLIERFGGTVSKPTPTGETISASQQMAPVTQVTQAPVTQKPVEKPVQKNKAKAPVKKAVADKPAAPALTVVDNTPRVDRNAVIADKKAKAAAARESRAKETSEREAKLKAILEKD